jgi:hypothetical protein
MTGNRTYSRLAPLAGACLLLCVCAVWLAHMPALAADLACMAPAILAFGLLGLGRYPGEGAIIKLAGGREPYRQSSTTRPRWERRAHLPRGGRLLACSLAGRGPPVPVRF